MLKRLQLSWMSEIVQEFRYAGRTLMRQRSFAALAILILALGMGASTAIFSLLNAVLYKSLAVKDPGGLVLLSDGQSSGVAIGTEGGARSMMSYEEFVSLRSRMTAFSEMFAVDSQWRAVKAAVDEKAPEEVRLRLVSGGYFSALGVRPMLGRAFSAADEHGPGSAPYAVISYRYWRGRFDLSSDVLNKRLTILGTSYTILGVMPPEFLGENIGQAVDLWVPLVMQPQLVPGRMWLRDDTSKVERVTWLQVFGRLRSGMTLEQAQSEAGVVFRQILDDSYRPFAARQPDLLRQSLKLRPGGQGASGLRGRASEPLFVLLGIVGVLLLTACGNVAGLMLARATARRKELALRIALGAGRARLIRQALAESLWLSLAASVAGSGVAAFAMDALLRLASTPGDPITLDLRPDWRVFAFVAGLAGLAATTIGLVPAVLSTGSNLNETLKRSAVGVAGGSGRARTGRVVVASQIALSTVLLVAAGWFVFTLRNLEKLNLGYPREHLLLVRVDPVTAGYRGTRLTAVYQDLQQRFAQLPGVRAVAYSDNGLFSGRESQDEVTVEGYTPPDGKKPSSRWDQVGPAYFSTLGIPFLQGREILPGDLPGRPRVCVINRAFAEQFFPHANPIGKHITDEYPDTNITFEIVGVSGNAHDRSLRDKVPPRFYIPALQPMVEGDYTDSMNYAIRTFGDPASLREATRRQIASVNPNIRVLFAQPLEESLAGQTQRDRLLARLAVTAGALAIVITCFGLFAVLSYSVAQRTAEIGVRIALGARPGSIVQAIISEALIVAAAGLAVGIPAALAASTLVKSLFFGLTAADPITLAAVVLALGITTVCSAAIPARRAAGVDPIRALRFE